MAATSVSSTIFANSPVSLLTRRPSYHLSSKLLHGLPSYRKSTFLLSSRRLISRRTCQIRATILQDEDEKVVVEDSFKSTSFPGEEGKACAEEGADGQSPSLLERGIIKVEQSINIFLTVIRLEMKEYISKEMPRLLVKWQFASGFDTVIQILNALYQDREYARFFVLETIARVPYFAFMSVLHLYETFGWWRRADYLKVHFAESWNEMHHLLIMEELGGSAWWFDRFLSQHIAVFYYFMTVFMYMISPRMAYHFSECVERHAFETYDKFLKAKGEELKKLPAPDVAVKYYTSGDLYLFDEFQTERVPNTRRPKIDNLYDVFFNIREDEGEHCKTMKACQTHGNLRSPHSYIDDAAEADPGRMVPQTD